VHVSDYICVAALAYLLGSLPTGYLAGKWRGIDVRTVGSGNIGATNVFRALGKTAGVIVLILDAFKGFVACRFVPLGFDPGSVENLRITAGFSAILGHNYTCWLKFKGGKGIATSGGVLLGWMPLSLAIVSGVWLVVFAVSRYVSLASITAALALPLAAAWVTGGSLRMVAISGLIGGLAVYKHRANIQRLLNGTEHRLGAKKTPASTESNA
jgi:acyl phosphate:glycerol-3-phosphate acyltransferase